MVFLLNWTVRASQRAQIKDVISRPRPHANHVAPRITPTSPLAMASSRHCRRTGQTMQCLIARFHPSLDSDHQSGSAPAHGACAHQSVRAATAVGDMTMDTCAEGTALISMRESLWDA
ncbi:hypothetical protein KZZ52_15170 [Dactylosporangium sp. AC04546]|nr:hypothetical protein [Dactylosporangium sp. AC04546]WVK86650.1 hypothetical protein KZZ52_15170 [Dactylosporangium sp. AC04546]